MSIFDRLTNRPRRAKTPALKAVATAIPAISAIPESINSKSSNNSNSKPFAVETKSLEAKGRDIITLVAKELDADQHSLLHWYRNDLAEIGTMAGEDVRWIVKDYLTKHPQAQAIGFDDRAHCRECRHWRGQDARCPCSVKAQYSLTLPQRCPRFTPVHWLEDQRSGHERWPDMAALLASFDPS